MQFYYEEFLRLSTRRGAGFSGPLPLPGVEIDRRAAQLGLTGAAAGRFSELIEYLDQVYLTHSQQDDDGRD